MADAELSKVDDQWCDFTERIREYTPTPFPPPVEVACAFPVVRDVLGAAVGLALCAGLVAACALQGVAFVRGLKPKARHTVEEDFAHYLSYSGAWREPEDVRAKLFEAFKAAW